MIVVMEGMVSKTQLYIIHCQRFRTKQCCIGNYINISKIIFLIFINGIKRCRFTPNEVLPQSSPNKASSINIWPKKS